MKLSLFNGINNSLDPSLLPPTDAVSAMNVDITEGVLKSQKGGLDFTDIGGRYGHIFHGSHHLIYDDKTDFTKYKGTLIASPTEGHYAEIDTECNVCRLDAETFDNDQHHDKYNHWVELSIPKSYVSYCIPMPPVGLGLPTPSLQYIKAINSDGHYESDECETPYHSTSNVVYTGGHLETKKGGKIKYEAYALGEVEGGKASPPYIDVFTIPANYADNTTLVQTLDPTGSPYRMVVKIDVWIEDCCDQLTIKNSNNHIIYDSFNPDAGDFDGYHLKKTIAVTSYASSVEVKFVSDCCGNDKGGTVIAERKNNTLMSVTVAQLIDTIIVDTFEDSTEAIITIPIAITDTSYKDANGKPDEIVVVRVDETEKIKLGTEQNEVGLKVFTDNGLASEVFVENRLGEMEEGTYTYAITLRNQKFGYETAPKLYENIVVPKNGAVRLAQDIQGNMNDGFELVVYRIGGLLDVFTEVAILTTASRNWFFDGKHSNSLGANTLKTQYKLDIYLMSLPTMHNEVLWCRDDKNKSVLRFSEVNEVWNFNQFSWIKLPADITGIASTQAGLFVATRNSCYYVLGETRDSIVLQTISENVGCMGHNTIQHYNNTLIFASYDGIYQLNRSSLRNLTAKLLPKYVVEPTDQYNYQCEESYYCKPVTLTGYARIYRHEYWLQEKSRFLVLNLRRGYLYNYNVFDDGNPMWSILGTDGSKYRGVTYIRTKDGMASKLLSTGVSDYLYNQATLRMRYKTPVFTEGSASNHKIYENFYVTYTGNIDVLVYIDGALILTYNPPVTTNKRTSEFFTPAEKRRGYDIYFVIEGQGTVYELEYRVQPRQGAN